MIPLRELDLRMARIQAPVRLVRRQAKERWGLPVIHILYTVWGHHTISSANGQDLYSASRAFSEG